MLTRRQIFRHELVTILAANVGRFEQNGTPCEKNTFKQSKKKKLHKNRYTLQQVSSKDYLYGRSNTLKHA